MMMKSTKIRAQKKGVILAIVLMVLLLLSIFGLYLGYGARQKIILVKRLSERDSLRFIAEAGIKKALFELSQDETPLLDTFGEEFLNNETSFKDINIGLGKFSICYNYTEGDTVKQMYGLIDEARKINVNRVNRATLQTLFEIVLNLSDTQAQELAASVVDFRDADSNLSIPLGSAEDSYYRNLGEPYDCKDAPFEVIDELFLVKGMSSDVFDRVKDFITIYGAGAVNINTAPSEVLLAVGIKEQVLAKIIAYRRGSDGQEGTLDDNIFSAPSSIVAELSQHVSLSSSEVANVSNLAAGGALGTGSQYFMIKSRAQLAYSSAPGEIVCIVDRQGKIVFWREM